MASQHTSSSLHIVASDSTPRFRSMQFMFSKVLAVDHCSQSAVDARNSATYGPNLSSLRLIVVTTNHAVYTSIILEKTVIDLTLSPTEATVAADAGIALQRAGCGDMKSSLSRQ